MQLGADEYSFCRNKCTIKYFHISFHAPVMQEKMLQSVPGAATLYVFHIIKYEQPTVFYTLAIKN